MPLSPRNLSCSRKSHTNTIKISIICSKINNKVTHSYQIFDRKVALKAFVNLLASQQMTTLKTQCGTYGIIILLEMPSQQPPCLKVRPKCAEKVHHILVPGLFVNKLESFLGQFQVLSSTHRHSISSNLVSNPLSHLAFNSHSSNLLLRTIRFVVDFHHRFPFCTSSMFHSLPLV